MDSLGRSEHSSVIDYVVAPITAQIKGITVYMYRTMGKFEGVKNLSVEAQNGFFG